MSNIDIISGVGLTTPASTQNTNKTTTKDFADVFNQALNSVAETDQADKASNLEMLSGEGGTLHGVLLEAEKADIALRLTLEVRNKVVDAYKEIMQMQV